MSSDTGQHLRYLTLDGLASQIVVTLTGVFFIAFVIKLGASNLYIGAIAAIPPLAQLFQLPAIYIVHTVKDRRKISVYCSLASRSFWFIAPFAPMLPHSHAILLSGLAISSLFSAVSNCAWNSWVRDLVPESIHGSYFSHRLAIATAGGLAASIAGAIFTDTMENSVWAYSALLGVAGVIGYVGVYFLSRVPNVYADEHFSMRALVEPYRDKNFRNLIYFSILWNLAMNLVAPFFTVYMLADLRISMSIVVALSALSQLMNIIFFTAWGKIADVSGNKPVLAASCPLYAVSLILWIFTAPQAGNMLLLIIVHALMGIATAGINIAASNIALKLAPAGRATSYLAANSIFSSLSLGVAPLIGGLLADIFAERDLSLIVRWHDPARELSISAIRFEHWDFLFVISVFIITYALHRLTFVKEGSAIESREIVKRVFSEARRSARSFSTIGGIQQTFPYAEALTSGEKQEQSKINSKRDNNTGGNNMVVKREMTRKFLEDAYAGESMAHMRYAIFAEKAEKEGLKNISNLFRAVSFAELVHARNHYNALGHVHETPKNLQMAIDGEHFENTEMYPVYNNAAKLQEESEAQRSTHYALEAEKIHEKLYIEAKKAAEQKKDVDYKKVYICPVCGYTVIGEAPDKCPVCGAPKEKFRLFEA